jgi:hypothetical protein
LNLSSAILKWSQSSTICSTLLQGLTLVHSSAQLKRLPCDEGCCWGLFKGCTGLVGGVRGVYGVILCQKRLKLS